MKTKKLLSFLLCGVFVVFFLSSCNSTKELPQSPAPKPQPTQILTPRPPNLVTWKSSLYSNIKKEDVLFFYNTFEIELKGVIPKYEESQIKDGGLSSLDTVFYVTKTVPAYTPGRVDDLIRDKNGLLVQMKINFDVSDRTYKLTYTLEDYARYLQRTDPKRDSRVVVPPIKNSGSFILEEKASLFYRGEESEVSAKINGDDDDRLLVKDTRKLTPVPVLEQAKGMTGTNSNGTPPAQATQVEKKGNEENPSSSPYTPVK